MGELVIATASGKVLVIDETEIAVGPPNGAGARIAGVRPGDRVVAVARVPTDDELADEGHEHVAEELAEIPEDIRQAVIDALATRMPHLRESNGRAWLEGAEQTIAEMARDRHLQQLVGEREEVNAKLRSDPTVRAASWRRDDADGESRVVTYYTLRDDLDKRIAARVVVLFRREAAA